MKTCSDIIVALEQDNSRLGKEAILQAEKANVELFEGFNLALSPYITFGVKQVPIRYGIDGPGYDWNAFKENIQKLVERKVTGNAARDLIQDIHDHCTNEQWNNWYRRILIKDLRCGVSEKTINKIKKNAVPVFECMLAHDGANHESKITGKKLLEPKLDGVRVITIVDVTAGTVIQYSRNGKILLNFTHITDSIAKQIKLFKTSMVLDGEIISTSFQALMKQVHRKDNVQAGDAVLMLFDLLPLSEFKSGKSKLGQSDRSKLLNEMNTIFSKIGGIGVIPQVEVDLNTEVGQKKFTEFNRQAIADGYEGIMIKDVHAVYECKRSASWLKQKPFIEVSLTVVETEEGTGRNAGKMGALVCEGVEDNKQIRVNVGSGFSDLQREEFWDCRVDGHVVEVRADAITQNQDGSYSLRFPRFVRFRGFAAGEKI